MVTKQTVKPEDKPETITLNLMILNSNSPKFYMEIPVFLIPTGNFLSGRYELSSFANIENTPNLSCHSNLRYASPRLLCQFGRLRKIRSAAQTTNRCAVRLASARAQFAHVVHGCIFKYHNYIKIRYTYITCYKFLLLNSIPPNYCHF